MPTPDSQLLKPLEFRFALVIENDHAKLSRLAKDYLTPLISYNKMPYNAMKLNEVDFNTPYTFLSAFHENNELTTLSVLKKAESSNKLIYRTFNTNNKEVLISLNHDLKDFVDLKEERIVRLNNKLKKNQVKKSFILDD